MPEAVIVSALRTPIGTAFKGTLRDTTAYDLAHHVVTAAADGLDPALVDDVVLGEGLYGGGVVARHAAITAGLTSVAGLAHNRHCAAGQAAVQGAAASVGGRARRPAPGPRRTGRGAPHGLFGQNDPCFPQQKTARIAANVPVPETGNAAYS